MQVEIKKIKLKKRVRKDLGDLDGLADSMARLGQLHPLVITRRYALISGRRRLAAAESLGWATIEAIMMEGRNKAQLLELELDENLQRSPLSTEEVEEALAKLDRLRNPGFFMRIWLAIISFFQRIFGKED
ncbi:MAG: chromosome partitioning protein ParB [Spirochaetales bacterium]|nr:MAG: chromosome partitioning protein ParB [Spirochaetales bacterium]